MKKSIIYLLSAIMLFAVSCSYDDSALVGRVDNLEDRVLKLEELCKQMNTNISSLQTLVNALQENDFVTGVTPITKDGETIGYTITFTKSEPITIYHGEDGHSPIIGVKQDADGIYYWTLDGDWLLDNDGVKIKAQGIDGKDGTTPKLKIENGYWHISYDNGATWTKLSKATSGDNQSGNSIFSVVVKDDGFAYFSLSDDTTIKIPMACDGAILNMKFSAKLNPVTIIQDIECDIDSNGVISGRIPHIVDSKELIPTFEYHGLKVMVDGEEIISGESVIDCSKPVTVTVVGSNGTKTDYTIEIMAFTGLPVMFINTEGNAEIKSKENYLNATIKIVEDIATRASGDVWESEVKIKGRGNSTWSMPKKPYKLKFNEKVSLLGEPKDKEWVLLANYTDKTAIRNELAFIMGRMSSMSYTCRTHFVDLILNNRYVGTYQLAEQLKISKDRVNVGDDGYLLEVDGKAAAEDITFTVSSRWWSPINIKDPDIAKDSEEYNYIVDYIRTVENVLYSSNFADPDEGYTKYIDVDSFIDWYLINEISRNNDSNFYTSCYMHHKPGDKLYMGPLWDFDIAFGNENYNGNHTPYGFRLKSNNVWYKRLFQDPDFVARVKEKFNYFYNNKDVIFNEINENAQYLKYSVVENNAVWQTLYEYTWPNYAIWGSYENEVAYLKQWLNARFEWLKAEFDKM